MLWYGWRTAKSQVEEGEVSSAQSLLKSLTMGEQTHTALRFCLHVCAVGVSVCVQRARDGRARVCNVCVCVWRICLGCCARPERAARAEEVANAHRDMMHIRASTPPGRPRKRCQLLK